LWYTYYVQREYFFLHRVNKSTPLPSLAVEKEEENRIRRRRSLSWRRKRRRRRW
jgi:hypothetical protein